MLIGVLAAVVLAPLYWIGLGERWRIWFIDLASIVALASTQPMLLVLVPGAAVFLSVLVGGIRNTPARSTLIVAGGTACLAVLFFLNKGTGTGTGITPEPGAGFALVGVSYLVLKVAATLIEAGRSASPDDPSLRAILRWLMFFPTYISGPMERLEHFLPQVPSYDTARVWRGLERILFGLVKSLLLATYIGQWVAPVIASPVDYPNTIRILALYGLSLRIYFDFAGYSDIAIGVAALYGYEIEENFDNPFGRRNLALLWQHWHMTLTRFLRLYLFIPVTRRLMRCRVGDVAAIGVGQVVAMTFCGLWHGVAWNFVVWGLLQAVGLAWLGTGARTLGKRVPSAYRQWWRDSPVARVASTGLTFSYFSLTVIYFATDAASATRYLLHIVGL